MTSFAAAKAGYDDDFFDYISIGSGRSAAVVAPLVLHHYAAKTVVDIGCGRGAWLAEWQRAGIADYLGIDGDYVARDNLLIPRERFLTEDLTKPFDAGRTFDLVVSLEVGEHIDPAAGDIFIDNLCRHSDAIFFSAAVPGQGGQGHVNEQNYDFWRQRFCARGYRLFDFVRPLVRESTAVEPWYRYNSLFFARGDALDRLSLRAHAAEIKRDEPIPDYAPMTWRLRNAVIKRLPTFVSDRLVEAKHRFVHWRHR